MFGWLQRLFTAANDGGADDGIPLDLAAVPGAFAAGDGFPRPQWPVITVATAALEQRFGADRVWCEVQRQWLEAIVATLGRGYGIIEMPSVLLLLARVPDDAEALARSCEGTLATVRDIVGAPAERCGKLPVFVFDSPATYYSYVCHFYGEGEYGTSAGVCLREEGGDVHVATFDVGIGLERTLAHEMVHALIRPGLPPWLEEGIAEVVSRRVARDVPLMLDAADVRRQQHHWRKHGLQGFWSGDSFHRGDRGQGLSYALAEVLVNNLLADHRRDFRDFLDEADAADAGAAAAQEHLGVALAVLASQFLGPGDWPPAARAADDDAPAGGEIEPRRHEGHEESREELDPRMDTKGHD